MSSVQLFMARENELHFAQVPFVWTEYL